LYSALFRVYIHTGFIELWWPKTGLNKHTHIYALKILGLQQQQQQQQQQPFYGPLSRSTQVSQYEKKHSPTHTYPDHQPFLSASFIYYVHSILHVQFMCLTVFLPNLSTCPLWSTSWSGTLHFILHTFLHPFIVFFYNTCPY